MKEFLELKKGKIFIMLFSIAILVLVYFLPPYFPEVEIQGPEKELAILLPAAWVLFALPMLAIRMYSELHNFLFFGGFAIFPGNSSEGFIFFTAAIIIAIPFWYIQTCVIYWVFKKFGGYFLKGKEIGATQKPAD